MTAAASARDRLEGSLERIADPSGEGLRTFLSIYAEAAREAADAADERARNGTKLGPLDGVIVSIKDLFDVAGETTRAGSTTLDDAPHAATDAPVVRRLRGARVGNRWQDHSANPLSAWPGKWNGQGRL